MSILYFVKITDHTTVPAVSDEREGPFYRYEEAVDWIEKAVEQYADHLAEQHQQWLDEQEGGVEDESDGPRMESNAATGTVEVYDATGALAATYTIEEEEDTDD